MLKRFFSSLRLRNSWTYRNHRWLLFINVACALLALSGAVSHYRSRTEEIPLHQHPASLPVPCLLKPSLSGLKDISRRT